MEEWGTDEAAGHCTILPHSLATVLTVFRILPSCNSEE